MPTYQCPSCDKVIEVELREDAPSRPFCSKRCKMLDLYKWFAGEYRVSDPLPDPSESLGQLPKDDDFDDHT